MNTVDDKPGIVIASAAQVLEMEELERIEMMEMEDELDNDLVATSLSSHIQGHFVTNRNARETSGIDRKMLQSLRAYNGHYDPEDIARIRAIGGSEIFMNLTPTKCRAAMSWIRDIMMPANEVAWSFEPTPDADIPEESMLKIKEGIEQFAKDRMELKAQEEAREQYEVSQAEQQAQEQAAPQQPQGQPGQPAAAPPPKAPTAPPVPKPVKAASEMKDINQMYRDISEAFQDEVYKIAETEVKKLETVCQDQLAEGEWDKAFSDFIEDFCVFQVALMKGPVVTQKPRLTWVDGEPEVQNDFIFKNKRVSPLDIYPSPNSTGITDGNLCEHLRLHRDELYNLIGVDGYHEDNIRTLLSDNKEGAYTWLDTSIEEDKAVEEYRGESHAANKGIFHGIHFHGTASGELLREWGVSEALLSEDELKEYQIEAILVVDKVIKVEINEDPLLRRPYYKASFQNIPGSWWGRSLPELMKDIQRMCNATARALSNNMGISSGPQIEIYTDRLAADEEIENMYPFKIWQVNSDPSGAGGRAVTFWQPQSNAQELLAVYKEFEERADDATGIPRYAYGNEKSGGAAQTASGMSMLLESASKGIKDAIRHIDDGLIKPRVEYQFYYNLISDPELDFTGDIVVVPKGSGALTMKGAQEQRRNEFLQILANPAYLEIVGMEGVAEILREMAKTLGLGTNIIPSRVELKFKQAQAKVDQARQQEMMAKQAQAQNSVGIEQVKMQTQQAEQASQRSAEIKGQELQLKQVIEEQKLQIKQLELQVRQESDNAKIQSDLTKQQMADAQKDRNTNKNIALSINSNYEDKNNQQ